MATRILLPIDESEWSTAAVDVTSSIATRGREATEVELLHVVPVTKVSGHLVEDLSAMLGFEPVLVPGQVEAFYRERGEALLARVAARFAADGIAVKTSNTIGNVVELIRSHAASADLVVMGLRGETEERFPGQGGAVIDRLLRRASTSTLVVPRGMREVTDIALGFDGSPGALQALRAAGRLAGLVGNRIHAIRVGTPPADPFAGVAEELGAGVRLVTHVVDGEPREALPYEANQNGCNVLALGHRRRSAVEEFFLGRTTEWLVGNVDLGLLVAR